MVVTPIGRGIGASCRNTAPAAIKITIPPSSCLQAHLPARRRLLSLAKLSARAAGDTPAAEATDTQLKLLSIQVRLGALLEQLGVKDRWEVCARDSDGSMWTFLCVAISRPCLYYCAR